MGGSKAEMYRGAVDRVKGCARLRRAVDLSEYARNMLTCRLACS
jgi:hypothetical protein